MQTQCVQRVALALWLPLCASLTAVLMGCAEGATTSSSTVTAAREVYLLGTPPENPRGVLDVRAELAAATEPLELTVTGRISGLNQPTWDPDRAVFMLADLSLEKEELGHAGDPTHDADGCPFCRAKKQKELTGLAMVQVLDEQGQIPPVDARSLLGLSEGDVICVRGEGALDSLGVLTIRTRAIYVQP